MDVVVQLFLLYGFALITGLRHGFDFDHVAAITDIVSSQEKVSRGFLFATLYTLGHSIIVIGLGLIALSLGQTLPPSVERIFQRIVGISLILLGLYVLFAIIRHGSNFSMRSRFMLLLSAVKYISHKLLHKFSLSHHHPKVREERYVPKTAFAIGMLHGIGAETPTQIAALATLVGIGGGIKGVLFLLFFVLGILISNSAISLSSYLGYLKAKQKRSIYLIVGFLTALFSLVVGVMLLK